MVLSRPIVEELELGSTNLERRRFLFATSVLQGLRRTLEEVTGAIDSTEAGPTVEEECLVQKLAREPGQVSYDEVTGLPNHPKLVADAIKGKLRVYHEVHVSYLDMSGLKAIGTRWVKGCASYPFIRARLVAQETKRVSEVTPEDASGTFAATCMTGKRRAPAEEKVLGFYDISRAHFHSPARRTIVIKVPREDDEWTSGYAVLDKAMYGTKDAAQCFDVASETAMENDTGKFSPCLQWPCLFGHGDDFVMSGTRTQQKEFEEQLSKHLIVKHLATLGPCTALGDVSEVRIQNPVRIETCTY